jgi:hypothetical protein
MGIDDAAGLPARPLQLMLGSVPGIESFEKTRIVQSCLGEAGALVLM